MNSNPLKKLYLCAQKLHSNLATIQTQRAALYLQSVAQTVTMHKGGQNWLEEQPGTTCSPIDAPQGHEMHPHHFTASIKSSL